jgi:ComEC/Rec2-related protein
MKTPLAPVALLYAAGLLAAHIVEAPIAAAFAVAFGFVLAALVTRHRAPLLAATLFLFGWLNLSVRTAIISPVDVRSIAGDHEMIATVRGTLAEEPTERVFLREDQPSWRTVAELRLKEIQLGSGEWRPAHGNVLTVTSGVLGNSFSKGQQVEATGVFMEPPKPVAAGLFDYRGHLAHRSIYYQFKIESPREWNNLSPALRPPITSRFRDWAQRALARGMPEQDEALRLQWAMLLGWQTALTNEVSEPFMRSGTMHIFAISGLHIALIAGIFMALLRAVMLPRLVCGAITIPLIWFYTAATGWQPSAIRSTIMMTVIIGGWALRRPMNLLNSLAAAALIILVWDPQQLFQASFQLSFFVVLSIALLVPKLDEWKQRFIKPDPMLPMELRSRWQRFGWRAANVIWKGLSVSLAAFIGSIPLIAYYFHLFTPGSLLANLIIVPVSSLALMSGLGAIITAPWLPALSECFNHSGWFFMRAMIWLSERATELPASWLHVRSPGWTEFAFYYGLLLAAVIGWFQRPILRWFVYGGLTGVLAVSFFQSVNRWRCAELTVLPLSGVHTTLIRDARSTRMWLVNCGEDSSFQFSLKPFLQSLGVNHIAELILAHGDTRHSSAMLLLDDLFHVARVHVPSQPSRSTRFRELLSDMELRTAVLRDATNGSQFGNWRVLYPSATDRFARGQDTAVVLLGKFSGVRVLLLNDLGPAGQDALISRETNLQADVVVTGLPDKGEPLPDELLARIRPRLIVVADADFPATRRASRELQNRLRRSGTPVLFTRSAGAVTITARDGRWNANTARDQRD